MTSIALIQPPFSGTADLMGLVGAQAARSGSKT